MDDLFAHAQVECDGFQGRLASRAFLTKDASVRPILPAAQRSPAKLRLVLADIQSFANSGSKA